MTSSKTPAQWFALLLATALLLFSVAVGLLALVSLVARWSDAHGALAHLDREVLAVAHWHTVAFALVAVLGFATWRRADSARAFALAAGLVLLGLALWAVLARHNAWPMPVSAAYAAVYATFGVAGLAVAAISPTRRVKAIRRAPRVA